MAVGRITGPLLKANLLRDGVPLAFETDLLYLDVVNGLVGVKTASPTHDLTVNGTTKTTNLIVDTQADVASFTFLDHTISSTNGTINLSPSGANPVVYQAKVVTGDLEISANSISVTTTDENLDINTLGAGQVNINSDVYVTGNVHAHGNIIADGNITIGDANTDNIEFKADVNSNLIPEIYKITDLDLGLHTPGDPKWDLGSSTQRWNTLNVQNIVTDTFDTSNFVVNGIDLTQVQGNIIYVATQGSDTNAGLHENDPVRTIQHAISLASAGDTIFVYAGTYEEILPLEIPAGVTIRGNSLRSVTITPTAATMYLDVFHMNGEATVEDFTMTGFHHDPAGTYSEFPGDTNGTGHAFRFSYGAVTTNRSPYIRNVSVLTYGTPSVLSVGSIKTEVIASLNRIKSVIPDIVQNNSVSASAGNTEVLNLTLDASDASTGTALQDLIDTVVYVINNGTLRTSQPTITANGTAVSAGMLYNATQILEANRDWIVQESYSYTVATYPLSSIDETLTKRDMGLVLDALIYDILRGGNEHSYFAGYKFWVQPANDPRGYLRGDAGHGALIDAEVLGSTSTARSMLFHSVTFITPAAETLIAKSGARVEWLNSFTYFANKGLLLESTAAGFAGQGKTRLRIDTRVGTWAVGNTVSYYDTNGTTVLASGVISSIDGNYVSLTGRCLGFETITDRVGKTVYAQGNAKLSTSQKKFGTASLALDGVNSYASIAPQPDFDFGTGDFTIECWVYPTAVPSAGSYAFVAGQSKAGAGNTSCGLYLGSAGGIIYLYSFGTFGTLPGAVVAQNAWSHIALTREGNSFKLWINGTQAGSTLTYTGAMTSATTTNFTVGGNAGYNLYVTGYIDDVRVSKGVARYTSTFTAPASALAGDLNTVLLLHFNGANNSTTLVDDGITYQDLRVTSGGPTIGTANLIKFADYSEFGAELRSIGSACVYGNYGAYGDGAGVVAYLISQNFAYVGSGKLSTNDPNDRIAANEVVELNGAKIYYTSVDNEGNFKVGDSFYVNQKTGDVLFNGQSLSITTPTGVTFTDGTHTTIVTPTSIDTGNIRISGNTVESVTGNLNVTAANNTINLQNNTYITGNLDVTGDITLGGNIQIGDQDTDTVTFVGGINSNLIPATNNAFDLGSKSSNLWWKNIYTNSVEVDSLVIDANQISTTANNDDLTLIANGTGRVYIPSNDVQINQNLTVNGTLQSDTLEVTNTLTVNVLTTGDIEINDNYIKTTLTDSDLILSADGTGIVHVTGTDVLIDQTLEVVGLTTLANVNINGNVVQYGDVNQTGNVTQTGTYHLTGGLTVDGTISQFSDIKLDANLLTTTLTNSDLDIVANGTGRVYIPNNDVQIDQNLTVLGTLYTGALDVDTTITSNLFNTGDIQISGNTITTLTSDLELSANGTGKITVPTNDVSITQQLSVTGLTSLGQVNINGNILQYGNVEQTGDVTQTGTYHLTGALTVDGQITQFSNIKFDDNLITTTLTNSDLDLVADGTGRVYIPSNDVQIDQNLTVTQDLTVTTGTTYLKNTSVTGTITQTGDINQTGNFTTSGNTEITGNITATGYLDLPEINITNNVISTKTAGTNLNLNANGTGAVVIDNVSIKDNVVSSTTNLTLTPQSTGVVVIDTNQSLVLPVGDNAARPAGANGQIRYNSELSRYEGYSGSYWVTLGGVQDVDGNTKITAELTPGANDNTLRFYADGTLTSYIDSTKLYATRFNTTLLDVYDNTITTLATDTNINLVTTGVGGVRVGNLSIRNNSITNVVNGAITEFYTTGEGYVKISGTSGVVIPAGDTEFDRPLVPELGMIRFNTALQVVEVYNGTLWTSVAGTGGGITAADATDIGIVTALLFG